MARVTVEDCIDKVENRFDLVLLASHHARLVSSGAQIAVERDNDKNPVVFSPASALAPVACTSTEGCRTARPGTELTYAAVGLEA